MRAKALFDCTADDIGELSFKEGDVLVDVIHSAEDGWYEGKVEGTSIRGLFPYNYVEILDDPVGSPVPIVKSTNTTHTQAEEALSSSEPKIAPSTSWSVLTKAETNEAKIALSAGHASSISEKKYGSSIAQNVITPGFPKPTTAVNLFTRKPESSVINTTPIIKPKPAISAKPSTLDNTHGASSTTTAVLPKDNFGVSKSLANNAYRTRSMSSPTANPSVNFGNTRPQIAPRPFKDASPEGNLKPSQLKNQETFGVVLRKTSPSIPTKTIPLNSSPLQSFGRVPKVAGEGALSPDNKEDDNSEDDEGYQLVKPSSLRQRSRAQTTTDVQAKYGGVRLPFANPGLVTQKKPLGMDTNVVNSSASSTRPTPTQVSPTKKGFVSADSTANVLDLMSAASNPAPRLPSRPTSSKRQRRPPSTRASAPSTRKTETPVAETKSQTSPPPIKAKPMMKLPKEVPEKQPVPSPEDSKPPSVSNLARQFDSNNSPSPAATPPALKPKSSSISLPQVPGKPLGLSNTNNTPFTLPPRPIPKPSTDSSTTGSLSSGGSNTPPVLRPKPVQYQAVRPAISNSSNEVNQVSKEPSLPSRPSFAKNPSLNATGRKKAAALPPPATASIPRDAKLRYEALFESIHDRNKVDGQTVKVIWRKSKLNDKVLADVWKHCDKESTGLLDKSSFVQGMGEIDERLRREMLKKQQRAK
ncbi:hypothetical protein Unana1_07244 [Umbelopsis nana]